MKKNILNGFLLSMGILSLLVFVLPMNKVSAEDGYDDNRKELRLLESKDDSERLSDDGPNEDRNDDKGGLRERLLGQKRDVNDDEDDSRKEGLMKKIHEFAKHRYEIGVERFAKLQIRVQNRIDKIKGEGKDTTTAQALLNTSIAKLNEAKGFIASAKALIDANVNTVPLPQNIKDQIKDYFTKAKASMKESYTALKDSVKNLKSISGGSSSPSSNENSNN